jgi:DNA (cytosine-5)-methyltransferase 1
MISDVLAGGDRQRQQKPKLLDLFAGAGGAAMGYHRAGFDVTGVDIRPQPHYPFRFLLADAMTFSLEGYDAIHCSPPCQAYGHLKGMTTRSHPQLIAPIRTRLHASGQPWVIENVVGAPLSIGLFLCGSMFRLATPTGVELRRHRLFESSHLLMSPGLCEHGPKTIVVNGHEFRNEASRWRQRKTITITGSTPQRQVLYNQVRETFSVQDARIAMGIDWMSMQELAQAIPPAYTEWIGHQLVTCI